MAKPMDYYSADEILATEEKLQVKFDYTIEGFGFYINSVIGDIKPNTRVALPYFLVAFLLEHGHCSLLGSHLARIRDDLDADATLVDLGNTHFMALSSYIEDHNILIPVLYERISKFARSIVKEDFSEDDLAILCHSEKAYMRESRKMYREFQAYYAQRVNY